MASDGGGWTAADYTWKRESSHRLQRAPERAGLLRLGRPPHWKPTNPFSTRRLLACSLLQPVGARRPGSFRQVGGPAEFPGPIALHIFPRPGCPAAAGSAGPRFRPLTRRWRPAGLRKARLRRTRHPSAKDCLCGLFRTLNIV